MSEDFRKGWDFFSQNTSSIYSSEESTIWVNDINFQYDKIVDRCQEICNQRASQDPSLAQGFLAEMWHTETFNLNSTIKQTGSMAEMLEETSLGSADIRITNENAGISFDISSKYYRDGASSAHEQSLSVYERFCRYASKHKIDRKDPNAFKEYLVQNGLDANTSKESALYQGQIRLIPQEQLSGTAKSAIEKLNRDIAKAQAEGNIEAVKRLTETKDALCGIVGDGLGTESISLSREDAEKIIRLCKSGKFNLSDYLDLRSLITFEDILNDSIKSGANAAMLSAILSIAPEIIKTIQFLVINGELDIDQLKELGLVAVSSSARGFLVGSISAAITSSAKLGFLGNVLQNMQPEIIGALTALTYQICVISFEYAVGKKCIGEMKNDILRTVFATGCSVALGSIASLINPFAYLLGSMIGSIAGSLIYGVVYKSYISFCTNTGFTLFGLVEQDYSISSEIAEIMGVDYIELDAVELDEIVLDTIQLDNVVLDEIKYDKLGLYWVKRGVIGINKIGYLAETI